MVFCRENRFGDPELPTTSWEALGEPFNLSRPLQVPFVKCCRSYLSSWPPGLLWKPLEERDAKAPFTVKTLCVCSLNPFVIPRVPWKPVHKTADLTDDRSIIALWPNPLCPYQAFQTFYCGTSIYGKKSKGDRSEEFHWPFPGPCAQNGPLCIVTSLCLLMSTVSKTITDR